MIDVALPAHRSCVTVDARRRLCAGCTVVPKLTPARRNTVGLQELSVCMAGGRTTGEDAA